MTKLKDVINRELSKDNPLFKTQKELYESMGMKEQTYFRALSRDSTKITTLRKFANALNISVEDFFKEPTKKEESEKYQTEYWKQKYEDSYRTNVQLVKTIEALSLGKRRGVLTA